MTFVDQLISKGLLCILIAGCTSPNRSTRISMGEHSSANQCAICLESIVGEAYLDQCFHKFCYHCILQWAEIVSDQRSSSSFSSVHCPLCKMKNTSIIHNFVGPTFQRHYISKFSEKSFVLSEAHIRRRQFYNEAPDIRVSNLNALEHWKRHGNLPSSHWLKCWIRRDLQALMQEEDVDIVVHHVLGVLEYFQRRTRKTCSTSAPELRRTQCKSLLSDAVRPFVFENSDRFTDELEAFLISGLDIVAYDELNMQSARIGYARCGSSGKELSSRDESVHSVSSRGALNKYADKHRESTRVQGFVLLDEDEDAAVELNIGLKRSGSFGNKNSQCGNDFSRSG